jgi:hypothetical protein
MRRLLAIAAGLGVGVAAAIVLSARREPPAEAPPSQAPHEGREPRGG